IRELGEHCSPPYHSPKQDRLGTSAKRCARSARPTATRAVRASRRSRVISDACGLAYNALTMARVYLETSFISACVTNRTDVASLYRKQVSNEWWETQRSRHELFVSAEVTEE